MPKVPMLAIGDGPQLQRNEEKIRARRRTGRRKPLNVGRIKGAIVFVAGWITALISGLTGLGAQSAYAPMLSWMLGFAPEKAQGTALYLAAWAAAGGIGGVYLAGGLPTGYVVSGLMLVVGAIIGALAAAPLSQKLQGQNIKRTMQTVGIALMMAVVIQVSHGSGPFATKPNVLEWHTPPLLLLLGLLVGTATQISAFAGGTLLVPALYFFSGIKDATGNQAIPAVALSLFVIGVAAILPVIAYNRKGLVDTTYRNSVVAAGLVGGFCGGWALTHMKAQFIILVSAVIAMFLCARELAKMSFSSGSEPEAS